MGDLIGGLIGDRIGGLIGDFWLTPIRSPIRPPAKGEITN